MRKQPPRSPAPAPEATPAAQAANLAGPRAKGGWQDDIWVKVPGLAELKPQGRLIMSGRYTTIRAIGLLLALGGFHPSVSAGDWYRYTSDNFIVYSDDSERRTLNMLREFEAFREVVMTITGLPRQPENSRMQIVIFDSLGEYNAVAPEQTLGFFFESSAGPRMVVAPQSSDLELTETLYHEYIHYLLNEHSDFNYPRWYQEGFAEFLSTAQIDDGRAIIGEAPSNRLPTLQRDKPVKVEDLIAPSDAEWDSIFFVSRFYANAWLMTHYLQITGFTEEPALRQKLHDYLIRYDGGDHTVEAFEKAFGASAQDMDAQLKKYRLKRVGVLGLAVPEYAGEIRKLELGDNQSLFLRASLAAELGRGDEVLDYTGKRDDEAGGAAQLFALQAVELNHRDEIEEARASAEKALELAPDHIKVLEHLSHWEWDNYERALKNGEDGSAALERCLQYGQAAIAADPDDLGAYRYVWQAQQRRGENVAAAKTLMAAYQRAPSNSGINQAVGDFLLQIDKPQLARPFLQRVYNWSHSEETRKATAKKLARIDASAESGAAEEEADAAAEH
ncbi:hypothetical protein E4634_16920 [Mangrovimicrobium sediminis]|uniref:DUF1570 domain-containing protein n=1 Tax=Mangrovimicrobium sediminis TaxID=2562682 RepID=A0A4Z0LXC7_9GAMM|nr:collagenase [Haliea sp. SAOS-164]TGD71797.1 hypothetical protein E4634_16920 [Haliea sp. SAOS-164]